MITFLCGLLILVLGGAMYALFIERLFSPDDRLTPAIARADGIDFTGMPTWKNALIELLSITGTGVILGSIQAVLFGPIAFLLIPVANIFGGAVHNYLSGMIAMRNRGMQMPRLMEKYLGLGIARIFLVLLMALLFSTGVVLLYTTGDYVGQSFPASLSQGAGIYLLLYAVLLVYFIVTTLFPIDRTIGRIYPLFSIVLFVTTLALFIGILRDGLRTLPEITEMTTLGLPKQGPILPILFITLAHAILSGLHASQSTLVARTVCKESDGRAVFFYTMLAEGFLSMCWAGGAMILFVRYPDLVNALEPIALVRAVSREFLGGWGNFFAFLCLFILPITTGDTVFRAIRLILGEIFHVNQQRPWKRFVTTLCVFLPALFLLVLAKTNVYGFSRLWRYYGFLSQVVATFGLAMASVYLHAHYKNYWVAFLPMLATCFIATSYILHAEDGLQIDALIGNPDSYRASYALAFLFTLLIGILVRRHAVQNAHAIRIREEEHR